MKRPPLISLVMSPHYHTGMSTLARSRWSRVLADVMIPATSSRIPTLCPMPPANPWRPWCFWRISSSGHGINPPQFSGRCLEVDLHPSHLRGLRRCVVDGCIEGSLQHILRFLHVYHRSPVHCPQPFWDATLVGKTLDITQDQQRARHGAKMATCYCVKPEITPTQRFLCRLLSGTDLQSEPKLGPALQTEPCRSRVVLGSSLFYTPEPVLFGTVCPRSGGSMYGP